MPDTFAKTTYLKDVKTEEINTETTPKKTVAEEFEKLILNYCREEFKCIQQLPKVDLCALTDYLFADGPLIKRISDALRRYSDLNFKVNTIENRSNFEVYDFKMVSSDDTLVVLSAKEFWNIEWRDQSDNPVKVYNKINRQTYFFKKKEGIWKIWDNHNPDYNGLISEVEEAYFRQNVSV